MKANLQKDNPLVIGYISAIIAALLFGSVSTVTKPIVSSVNPLLLSCLVCLISGVTITPVVNRIKYSVRRKDYLLLITTSIFGAVIAPAMFFFGLKLTTAIDSSLLSNGEVIFSILLALTIFGEIDFLSTKIRELDNKIKKVASDDKYAKHLITIPGISYYAALLISSEIADINRFPDYEHLSSYVKLVPSIHQSGETQYSKADIRGSQLLNWIMIQCIHIHVRL